MRLIVIVTTFLPLTSILTHNQTAYVAFSSPSLFLTLFLSLCLSISKVLSIEQERERERERLIERKEKEREGGRMKHFPRLSLSLSLS